MSTQPFTALRRSFAALLCVGAIGVAVPVAQAEVNPLIVSGKAPTSLTIHTAGMNAHEVKVAIHHAAGVVCSNAFVNGDLGPYGDDWCPVRATERALVQYDALVRSGQASFASLTVQSAG